VSQGADKRETKKVGAKVVASASATTQNVPKSKSHLSTKYFFAILQMTIMMPSDFISNADGTFSMKKRSF